MRSLRLQLLFSHLVLVLLMVVVMAGAVLNFRHLGRSIDRILRNNYKSVIAAQNMKETLERQDSATTFFLAGQVQQARAQYELNRPLFEAAYQVEAGNVTEPGEQQLADEILRDYTLYEANTKRLLYGSQALKPEAARSYYFNTLKNEFLRLKDLAQAVLNLNQQAIINADRQARTEAERASVIGIGVTAASFVAAILFALNRIMSAMSPLRTLARQAEEIGAGHLNQSIDLRRADEIGALALAFNRMTERLREARRIEEERLHRAERMSDAALESLYDPVIVTDAERRVVHLNPAAQGLFGPADRLVNQPIARAIHDTRITEAVERAIRHERISAAEDEAGFIPLQLGGAERIYRLRTTPMRDEKGAVLGAVVVLEDVTYIRELDRLKTEFIGVASHELRTPVTSLLLSVQILEEGAVGPLSPEQRQVVGAQREDLERLDTMMGDLLELTRLEAGVIPPRFQLVPPYELGAAAMGLVKAQADARKVHLTTRAAADLPQVQADPAQITRVLVNLLVNAIRHTPESGKVQLEVDGTEQGVQFAVRDTGSGIPADYLSRIFDRFVQVPGATRGGAGLGLSIAQTMVQAHGREIKVESDAETGTVFTFSLPAAPRPE